MEHSARRTPFKPLNGIGPEGFGVQNAGFGAQEGDAALVKIFPATFNPRREVNMPHREKVDKWIVMVPTYPSSDMDSRWDNSCYSPGIGLSDFPEDEDFESAEFDFANVLDVVEFQARAITFQCNRLYYKDMEAVRRPVM